ncbi:MAG: ribonuclease Z [Thermomicrobiales bacterium]|nr:ribonuclease Z [Thermomicrobiales bacterium]
MIDLLLLGTGGMMPMPNRWLSSLLMRCRGEITLFDCGEGTQIPWRTTGWGFHSVSSICLTHWHADHVAGLPGLLHTIGNSGRTDPLSIYGPVGIADVVSGLRVIAPLLPYAVVVRELGGGDSVELPEGLVGRVIEGQHRLPTLIYRIDLARSARFDRERAEALGVPIRQWSDLKRGEPVTFDGGTVRPEQVLGPPRRGLSMGFMTDTRPVDGAAAFLSEVDLLVSEGTYGDSTMIDKAIAHKHMTFAEAATIAHDARVRQLWLTHFSPSMERPEEFAGNATAIFAHTTIGYSGLATTLSFED